MTVIIVQFVVNETQERKKSLTKAWKSSRSNTIIIKSAVDPLPLSEQIHGPSSFVVATVDKNSGSDDIEPEILEETPQNYAPVVKKNVPSSHYGRIPIPSDFGYDSVPKNMFQPSQEAIVRGQQQQFVKSSKTEAPNASWVSGQNQVVVVPVDQKRNINIGSLRERRANKALPLGQGPPETRVSMKFKLEDFTDILKDGEKVEFFRQHLESEKNYELLFVLDVDNLNIKAASQRFSQ